MKSKQDGSTRGWQTPPLRLLVASRDGSKQLSHPSPSIVPFPLISSSPLPLLAFSSPLHSLRIPGSLTALRGPLRELTGTYWNRKHVFGYWKCADNIHASARAREALPTEYQESGSAAIRKTKGDTRQLGFKSLQLLVRRKHLRIDTIQSSNLIAIHVLMLESEVTRQSREKLNT